MRAARASRSRESQESTMWVLCQNFSAGGYAAHLVAYILTKAKKLGARHCFLESSDSGLGVYQKIGFELLFKNTVYSGEAVPMDVKVQRRC